MNSCYLPSRSEHWKWDRQILVFKLSCMKKKKKDLLLLKSPVPNLDCSQWSTN